MLQENKEVWEKFEVDCPRHGSKQEWHFRTDKVKMTLPIKAVGNIYHSGWDIPTGWVIDSANQCWADHAHGSSLEPCTASNLITMAQNENDFNTECKISEALGLAKPQPEWVKTALAHGWTPPKDFKL